MTIEKLKSFEPLFDAWSVEGKIAEGRHSKVFRVANVSDGKVRHQCLKTIKFPSGNEELSQVISSGIYTNVQQYLDEVERSVRKNMDKMLTLRGNKNIVRFDNYTIIKENSCFYLVILMELLTPLSEHMRGDSAVQNDVIRLGTDICSALSAFRSAGIVHHEIKPENIYVDRQGNFKLGDFGVCKGRFGEDKIVSSYIAPELYGTGAIDISSDIYSLGILIYKLLNNNRLPFLPQYPAPVSVADRELAFERRMRGDLFPAPSNSTPGLANVIYKATALHAHERFLTPEDFSRNLEANYVFAPPSAPLSPPVYAPAVPFVPVAPQPQAPEAPVDGYDYDDGSDLGNIFEDDTDDSQSGESVSKKWYFIIIALVIILAVVIAAVSGGKKKDKETTTTTTQAITFGQQENTYPTADITTTAATTSATTSATTESTTESTTATTTSATSTTVDSPSAVTTTTDPNTTQATLPSTSATTTTETTTQTTTETTTVPPVTDPQLIYNFNGEGSLDTQGRPFTPITATVQSVFNDKSVTVKLSGLPGESFTVNDSKIFIYTLEGSRPVRSSASATVQKSADGSLLCYITAEDASFDYDPAIYKYYVCIEEEAIASESATNIGVQVRV